MMSPLRNKPKDLRLAIVGDVHDQWHPEDDFAALKHLDVDMVLFVGDFGNSNVRIVSQIAQLDMPKAVILGNHDAWNATHVPSSSKRPPVQQMLSAAELLRQQPVAGTPTAHASSASNPTSPAAVSQRGGSVVASSTAPSGTRTNGYGADEVAAHPAAQALSHIPNTSEIARMLEALGACHVGFSHLSVHGKQMSVVGGRPFSQGGRSLRGMIPIYNALYNVTDFASSAKRIADAVLSAPEDHGVIMMAHNGPAGLGSNPWDPCGVDWTKKDGDHGDPDLQDALTMLKDGGKRPALLVHGHMHHRLHRSKGSDKLRRMVHIDAATDMVHLNAAVVPRITACSGHLRLLPGQQHHFMVVEIVEGVVVLAKNVWVHVSPAPPLKVASMQSSNAAEKAPLGATLGDSLIDAALTAAEGGAASGSTNVPGSTDTIAVNGHNDSVSCSSCSMSNVVPHKVVTHSHGKHTQVVSEEVVLKTTLSENTVMRWYWDAYDGLWRHALLSDSNSVSALLERQIQLDTDSSVPEAVLLTSQ